MTDPALDDDKADDTKPRKATPQTTVLVISDEAVWLAAQRQGKALQLKLAREIKLDRLKTGMLLSVCTGVKTTGEGERKREELVISKPIPVSKHWHETEDGGYADKRTLCAAIAAAAHPCCLQVWTGNPGDGELGRITLQG
jgi:hypothetical protein